MVLNVKKRVKPIIIVLSIIAIAYLCKGLFANNDNQPLKNPEQPIIGDSKSALDNQQNEAQHSFFASYRIERERVRGQQIEMLQTILNDRNIEKAAREAASLQMINLSAEIDKEVKAESLIKSLGFSDCVVINHDQVTNVVIPAKQVNAQDEKNIKNMLGLNDPKKNGSLNITIIN